MQRLIILCYSLLLVLGFAFTVTAALHINVYQGPGFNYPVIGHLPPGAQPLMLGQEQGWYKIRLDDGREGWLPDERLQSSPPAPSAAGTSPAAPAFLSRSEQPAPASPSVVQNTPQATAPAVTRPAGRPFDFVSTPPEVSRRTALVIGNAQYAEVPLRNPEKDASGMTAALRQLGFEVTLLRNSNLRQMEDAIETLHRHLQGGGVGLFYYAGHGMQVDGENYLIPIGARINRQQEVRYEALALGKVLGAMEDANNGLNILILDACRDAPITRQWRSATRGLAVPKAARGTFIAYATAPGGVAADGEGQNGIYTKYLLQAMTIPHVSVEEAFKVVRQGVVQETKGQQVPWESSSLVGHFAFVPTATAVDAMLEPMAPPALAPPQSPVPPPAVAGNTAVSSDLDPEATMWQLAEKSSISEDIRDFLRVYPHGRFAPAAQLRLKQLQRQQTSEVQPRSSVANRSQPELTSRSDAPAAASGTLTPGTRVAVGVTPQSDLAQSNMLRNSLGMEFVRIPAGEFMMGAPDGAAPERPVHRVRISRPFYMGRYEVTQGEWEAVMGRHPGQFGANPNLPVQQVSWTDTQRFIARLNTLEQGAGYRLPTEAEWEYAARAGSTTAYSFAAGARLQDYAWYRDNAASSMQPVGSLRPNAWGLYDMHGNVWEWIQDWYGPYPATTVSDPQGRPEGIVRVQRGGGWYDGPENCRSAHRSQGTLDFRNGDLGFRLVQEIP